MKFSKIKLQMVQEEKFNYNSRIITSSKDIVKCVNEYEELEKATEEHMLLICLNTKNQIIAYSELSKGGANYCCLDVKSIFKTILLCNANRFILVHNHPSGTATASKSDVELTEQVKKASEIMNIDFLDHIIVAGQDFTSCMSI